MAYRLEPSFTVSVKITPEIILDVSKQPVSGRRRQIAGERLRHGHDRQAVTQKVMQALMAKFEESV